MNNFREIPFVIAVLEYGSSGIRVNAIYLYVLVVNNEFDERDRAKSRGKRTMRSLASPEEIANVIGFFISTDA